MLQRERFIPAIRLAGTDVQRKILVINGHPDPRPERFCAALCQAYEEGARFGGWDVRRLDVGSLPCSPDQSGADMDKACQVLGWATQLMIIFPLWLGRHPPTLRSLFEEELQRARSSPAPAADRFARSVITMAFPAFAHRALSQCEVSVPKLEADIALPGIRHQARDFIGSVNTISAAQRAVWLTTLRRYGLTGQ